MPGYTIQLDTFTLIWSCTALNTSVHCKVTTNLHNFPTLALRRHYYTEQCVWYCFSYNVNIKHSACPEGSTSYSRNSLAVNHVLTVEGGSGCFHLLQKCPVSSQYTYDKSKNINLVRSRFKSFNILENSWKKKYLINLIIWFSLITMQLVFSRLR